MLLKRILSLTLVMALSVGFAASGANPSAATSSLSPQQVKDVQQVIHDYLLSNPGILVQAWQKLQEQKQAEAQAQAIELIKANYKQIFYDPSSPVTGNKRGKVTLVEFFDYQCVHCKEMGKIIKNLTAKNKNLRVVFKDWPIFGGNSILAAKAAFAANMQGKYLAYHNALLSAKPPLDQDKLNSIASKLKLNMAKFNLDMSNQKWDKVIKSNSDLATKLKLIGTPAFIVGNKSGSTIRFIPGVVTQDVMAEIIREVPPR